LSAILDRPGAPSFPVLSPLGLIQLGDPLARAIARLHFPPFLVAALVAIAGAVHALILPAVFGHLRTVNGIPGSLDDWPALVIHLVTVPLIMGYYAWQPAIIETMYNGLVARMGQKPAPAAFVAVILRPLAWRVWVVIAILVGALECLSWISDIRYLASPIWQTANWLMIISYQPLRFITFYALVFILLRQIVVMIGLIRFFGEFTVEIQPLHPDRAGGLRVLGDYVLTNGMLIAMLGLILGMDILRGLANSAMLTPEIYLELGLYFVVAPMAFFLPLWSAHSRMAAAKQKLLAEISEQSALEYGVILHGLRRNELKVEAVERLEAIQKIYGIAQFSPDWPFNIGILSKFAAAVLLPVLAPLGVELVAKLLLT
jgi:hypothetical protein